MKELSCYNCVNCGKECHLRKIKMPLRDKEKDLYPVALICSQHKEKK